MTITAEEKLMYEVAKAIYDSGISGGILKEKLGTD